MNHLSNFISQYVPLDPVLENELDQIINKVDAPKGTVITSPNTHCRNLYFIKKGIVKFCFNSGGKEFIMRFFEEGILFTDLESWNKKEVSKYDIVTLEQTEFITIPLLQFEKLCQKHHSLEKFYRKVMTMASLNMMERIKEMLEEDAKKRYSNFVETYPNLVQRISLGDVSKYLGITQVSLSRIRTNK